jgi:autotransporter translocation and assembly factor TamB
MVRRFLQVAALLCTLVIGAASIAVIVSQTTWFKDWLRGYIVRQADSYLNGRLAIGRLGGNLFSGVELENVSVSMDGRPVIAVKDVGLDYSVLDLLRGGVVIDDIRLNEPELHLVRTANGWNIGRLVKQQKQEAKRDGPARPIAIGEIGISDGTFTVDGAVGTSGVAAPHTIERLNAQLGFEYDPVNYTVRIGHISFRAPDRGFALNDFSGTIATKGDDVFLDRVAIRTQESSVLVDGAIRQYLSKPDLNLKISSDKLALQEIARVVPALKGISLQPAFSAAADGPLDRLKLGVEARSSAGSLDAKVTGDFLAPRQRVAGTIDLRHLDLAAFLRESAQHSDITGKAIVDLRMTGESTPNPLAAVDGRWQLVAPRVVAFGYEARDIEAKGRMTGGVLHLDGRALAYGGRATVQGTITPGTPLALDISGRAANLDLRNLPRAIDVPKAESDLNAAYRVTGALGETPHLVASVKFAPSMFAGAHIAEGGTARVTIDGKRIGYAADASLTDLDLQRVGRALDIAALSTDRFASAVNGTVSVNGSGTSLATLAVTARGTLADSRLFGGSLPKLAFDTTLDRGALRLALNGSFAGFNPGTLSGRPDLDGNLSGTANVRASIANLETPVDPAGLAAEGQVSLERARIGKIALDSAAVDGTFADRAGDVRQLTVKGPDISVDAHGHVSLRDDSSNLSYKVDVGSVESFAQMAGQQASGSIATEGTLTGGSPELQAHGTLEASNLRYGTVASVLSLGSKYSVTVPDLDPSRLQLTADSTATLVEAGGVQLTEITAKTTWGNKTLGFDTRLRDQKRALAVNGDLVLHPDHEEVHLRDLALETEGVEWRTPQGSEAAIQYGNDRIAVQGLQLVSGPQRITADGAFGAPADRLQIEASAVDLASIDRLALGNQRIGGQLNASATVTGTREAPEVSARFGVANGSFRDFHYQDFSGTAIYGQAGARFGTRLTQKPGAWIEATGFVPAAAFSAPAANTAAGAHETPAPGQGIDVAVKSSALDLGIVQGFVPQLTKVSGTLQADVRVTGTVRDPHMEGFVDVRNGAFTIADLTKDGYTGLDTRIALEPDVVRIKDFTLLDEHKHPLNVSGQLALHARKVGAVQIAISSREFEVVDNELADVKLNTDLQVTGELRAPVVKGTVGVHTGTIDIEQVLSTLTTDAYAVQPTKLETTPATPGAPNPAAAPSTVTAPAPGAAASAGAVQPPPAQGAPAPEQAPAPSAFDALALDVRLKVPNNLVVKGKGINPGGASPIGLGDVNVTLGGEIHATKKPGSSVHLLGEVNTVRGTYDFQGRRFEIQRDGTVRFTGSEEINPMLDLTAERLISGVSAIVHIGGTARKPELRLTSRPPLDEADILSLIIFNQPSNQLGEGDQISLAQRASALATGFVASSLAQSIGSALELDVFEIQTSPESGGSPAVTIGEQVGERLFVKFRQAFGAQSVSQFILEYQLADFLRLQTAISEGAATERSLLQPREESGIDLIFYFTY